MEALKKKVLNTLKIKNFFVEDLEFLAGDASDRKYFSAKTSKHDVVIMLDENIKNLNKFLKITKALETEISVPQVYEVFENSGIAVIENFGQKKYSKILTRKNCKELYELAVANLIFVQSKKISVTLPQYDMKKLLDESNLFFDWYLPFFKIKKKKLKEKFNVVFENFLINLKKLPQVFIHRDYHVDNLFFLKNRKGLLRCGWIDYQDALFGPALYDLVSLTQDARIDVPEKIEKYLINFYLENNKNIDHEFFSFCYGLIGIQRHLKVLGIFCRLSVREKKNMYLSYLPRVKKMLLSNLMKNDFSELYSILGPLIKNE